ncbi:MAG: gamma-glutamyltransferase [Gemmatimonadaceae bacterium]
MATSRRTFLQRAAVAAAASAATPRRILAGARATDVVTPYFGRKPLARGRSGVAITSNPHATRAAVETLRAGGNACDAALCASAVQTVTEPHMTTITGMLSMLYFDAATGKLSYCNGGMNAPLAPLPGFNGADLATGRGAGVPGWWGGFEAAREKLGTRTRAQLLAPAIGYARDGFAIYPFLYGEMFSQLDTIGLTATGRSIYMPNGALLPPGATLRQPQAAEVLERLAADGSAFFYHGAFAQAYCEAVKAKGGVITPADFERYTARWDEPARGTYHGYDVVGSLLPTTAERTSSKR